MNQTNCQVLEDISSSGKTRNWKLHKINSIYISTAYEEIDPSKARRIKECANWLSYVRGDDGMLKLHDARFCRVRLCPICQWRRSLKTFVQMSKVISYAQTENYSFIFLTLTVRNCTADNLSEEITHLLQSFNRLSKYKKFKECIDGFYRGCEVTHNLTTDEYHPHLHCVLAVKPSYFTGRKYISQKLWSELWQKALQVDYNPIVDVRKCKGDFKSISEACKYAVKPSDIINFDDWKITVDTLKVLDKALENRRFTGLGGCLKDFHKILNLDDLEDGDLTHIEIDPSAGGYQEEIIYFWNGYSQYERR